MGLTAYVNVIVALIFVLALIGLVALAARRFTAGSRMIPRPGRRKRLGAVEIAPVDAKRRLVLLRRDDREHLLLLGPQRDVVIETGIEPPPDSLGEPESAAGTTATPGFPDLLRRRFRSGASSGAETD